MTLTFFSVFQSPWLHHFPASLPIQAFQRLSGHSGMRVRNWRRGLGKVLIPGFEAFWIKTWAGEWGGGC